MKRELREWDWNDSVEMEDNFIEDLWRDGEISDNEAHFMRSQLLY